LFMTGDKETSIGGGVLKKGRPLDYGVNYFQVNDLAEAADKVVRAGGMVVVEEHEVPMVGQFVICEDPEGNRFGLWKQVARG
jgi:predicted enzyme related to lactoylglutathione lyase